jgi:hypothetical protein
MKQEATTEYPWRDYPRRVRYRFVNVDRLKLFCREAGAGQSYTLDSALLARPGNDEIQLDLSSTTPAHGTLCPGAA